MLNNTWKPIGKKCPTLSHLFFADDLVIIRKANDDQTQVIRTVLDVFHTSLGHKVSTNKTFIFFYRNVNVGKASRINKNFGSRS